MFYVRSLLSWRTGHGRNNECIWPVCVVSTPYQHGTGFYYSYLVHIVQQIDKYVTYPHLLPFNKPSRKKATN